HDKLVALKDKLRKDTELGPRVFEYRLGWDAAAGKVTGLEAFEQLVFDKLWAVIDEETRADASKVPPTWEEQERSALAEFVEHRSRIFVGREDVIKQLLTIARSPTSEPKDSTLRGACVTGSPGSGKSAVFAKLYRELEPNDRETLLLANAAGGTRLGASVDAMLRRWIVELSTAAGTANPLPEPRRTMSRPRSIRCCGRSRQNAGWWSCSTRSTSSSRPRAGGISPGLNRRNGPPMPG
ncbi:MAG: ATP-binding protein, partial [Pontiellaceae bacterium]|nr:ATP-binding protein [Pontiellaceae bacterium]